MTGSGLCVPDERVATGVWVAFSEGKVMETIWWEANSDWEQRPSEHYHPSLGLPQINSEEGHVPQDHVKALATMTTSSEVWNPYLSLSHTIYQFIN